MVKVIIDPEVSVIKKGTKITVRIYRRHGAVQIDINRS